MNDQMKALVTQILTLGGDAETIAKQTGIPLEDIQLVALSVIAEKPELAQKKEVNMSNGRPVVSSGGGSGYNISERARQLVNKEGKAPMEAKRIIEQELGRSIHSPQIYQAIKKENEDGTPAITGQHTQRYNMGDRAVVTTTLNQLAQTSTWEKLESEYAKIRFAFEMVGADIPTIVKFFNAQRKLRGREKELSPQQVRNYLTGNGYNSNLLEERKKTGGVRVCRKCGRPIKEGTIGKVCAEKEACAKWKADTQKAKTQQA